MRWHQTNIGLLSLSAKKFCVCWNRTWGRSITRKPSLLKDHDYHGPTISYLKQQWRHGSKGKKTVYPWSFSGNLKPRPWSLKSRQCLSLLNVLRPISGHNFRLEIMFIFNEMVGRESNSCWSCSSDSSKVMAPHPFSDSYFMAKFFGVFPSDRKTQSHFSQKPKNSKSRFKK